jgi:predicted acyl esterase
MVKFIKKSLAVLAALTLLRTSAEAVGADKVIAAKIYGDTRFPVYYTAALPTDAAGARYPGYRPEKSLLSAGTVRGKNTMPLVCDILFERDVPIRLRDGVIIYADVFRPVDEGRYPALLCVSPFGKEVGAIAADDFPDRLGVNKNATSGLECFGGLDPAYWVLQGYVIVNPDPRGVCASHGNVGFFGRQAAEDGYDMVEWAALQPWCNGRVGMAGVSWLSTFQWFTAAEQPPHLEAIAPWGGFADFYRDASTRGGIPVPSWAEQIVRSLPSRSGMVENLPQMILRYPFVNSYWKDKTARLEDVTLPIYAAAAFDDESYNGAAFDAFRRAGSTEKWLRTYRGGELADLYNLPNEADLTKFFDYYLKDMNNGWERTPRVRIAVDGGLSPREDNVFPPASVQNTCLYLNAGDGTLSSRTAAESSSVSYNGEDERSSAKFVFTFDRDTELTGYASLHLWVAAADHDDLDLAVTLEKLDKRGKGSTVARGRIRASCRALDDDLSFPGRPVLACTAEQKLVAEHPAALDIALTPMALQCRAGERLRLTLRPWHMAERRLPLGSAKIEIPRDSFTVDPRDAPEMLTLGGAEPAAAPTLSAPSQNVGAHIIYTGGEYDSYLQLPVMPRR